MDEESPPLVIKLNGPGWRAELVVAEPPDESWRQADFEVPLTADKNAPRQQLLADVRYTTAHNRLRTAWDKWFVKVYRCRDNGEADLLRRYLGKQAASILTANAALPGPSRIQVDPPWAAVPVHVARCDGLEENVGPVTTELAASPAEIRERVRQALPAWATGDPPEPERYLLAISPFMDRLHWDDYRGWPATEHLRDFVPMAAGLDTLHRLGTVHCDIKPDNVCRYNTHQVSGYVLIDTDSVTQVAPAPKSVRSTKQYCYRGLAEWFGNQQLRNVGVDAALLKAHDRFGFAIVVLTALAGRDWVDRVLLRNPDLVGSVSVPDDRRTVDDRQAVIDALRQLWPDNEKRMWMPLIEALAQPFGPEIESANWTATAWIERILRAEKRCVVGQQSQPLFDTASPPAYRRYLDDILRRTSQVPARRQDLAERGYQAVQDVGHAVARRAAVGSALRWSLVALPVFVLVFTLFKALW
jgi:hypothetical protein